MPTSGPLPLEQDYLEGKQNLNNLYVFVNGPASAPNKNIVGNNNETLAKLKDDLFNVASAAANLQTYVTFEDMEEDTSQPIGTTGEVQLDPGAGRYVWTGPDDGWVLSTNQPVTKKDLEPLPETIYESRIAYNTAVAQHGDGHTIIGDATGSVFINAQGKNKNAVEINASGESYLTVDTSSGQTYTPTVITAGGVNVPGITVDTVLDQHFVALSSELRYMREAATQFALNADGSVTINPTVQSPPAHDGGLWASASGYVRVNLGYHKYLRNRYGEKSYYAPWIPSAQLEIDTQMAVLYADQSPSRATRSWQGIPTIEYVPSRDGYPARMWAAYYGDRTASGEANTNYVILRYSSDEENGWQDWSGDYAYVINETDDIRPLDPVLWTDPLGRLWLFFSQSGGPYGVWAVIITNPLSSAPMISRPMRLWTTGIPGKPTQVDGRWLMPVALRESPTFPQHPAQTGKLIFAIDYIGATLVPVGKLPDDDLPSVSYQEPSLVQLRNGPLAYMWRVTGDGQRISYSLDGNPEGPWTEPERWEALPNPASVNTRAALRMSPDGEYIVAFNDASNRTKMTVAAVTKDLQEMLGSVLLESGNSTYPDLTFDYAGNAYAIYDTRNTTAMAIKAAQVSVSDLVNEVTPPSTIPFTIDTGVTA